MLLFHFRSVHYSTLFLFLFIWLCYDVVNTTNLKKPFQKRALPLVYANKSAVYQFICGFGIPVDDLEYETITSGIVFKSQYLLPSKSEDLRNYTTHNINGRSIQSENFIDDFHKFVKSRQLSLSKYRWIILKAIELLAENFKQPGKQCVLKSICEATSVSFHYSSGIIGEIAHIIFTPTSSMDELSNENDEDYLYAENLGKSGESCNSAFPNCTISILESYSHIFDYFG